MAGDSASAPEASARETGDAIASAGDPADGPGKPPADAALEAPPVTALDASSDLSDVPLAPEAADAPVAPDAREGVHLFVSPTGADTNPGTEAAPLKTLHRASAVAPPGATIWLLDGLFEGTGGPTEPRLDECAASSVRLPAGSTLAAVNPGKAVVKVASVRGGVCLAGGTIRGVAFAAATASVAGPLIEIVRADATLEGVQVDGGCAGAQSAALIVARDDARATFTPGALASYLGATGCAWLSVAGDARVTVRGGAVVNMTGEAVTDSALVTLGGRASLTLEGVRLQADNRTSGLRLQGEARAEVRAGSVLRGFRKAAVELFQASRLTLDGSTLSANERGVYAMAGLTTSDSQLSAQSSFFEDNRHGIDVEPEAKLTATLRDTRFVGGETGIYGYGAAHVTFLGGEVRDATAFGINLTSGARGCSLFMRKVTIKDNPVGVKLFCSFESPFDLGRGDDPGQNLLRNKVTGIDASELGSPLLAVGNTWHPNEQGADGNGQYSALGAGAVLEVNPPWGDPGGLNYRVNGRIRLGENPSFPTEPPADGGPVDAPPQADAAVDASNVPDRPAAEAPAVDAAPDTGGISACSQGPVKRVSQRPGVTGTPALVAVGHRYLVVWEEDPGRLRAPSTLYGTWLTSEGERLAADDIALGDGREAPSLARLPSGEGFLLLFHDGVMLGTLALDKQGARAGDAKMLGRRASTRRPVVSALGQLFVAAEEEIAALDETGAVAGPWVPLREGGVTEVRDLRLVAGPEALAAVYYGREDTSAQTIRMRLFDRSLTLTKEVVLDRSYNGYGARPIGVWNGRGWTTAFETKIPPTTGYDWSGPTHVQRLTAEGTLAPAEGSLVKADYRGMGLASDGWSEALVVGVARPGHDVFDSAILFAALDPTRSLAELRLEGTLELNPGSGGGWEPAVVSTDRSGEYGVAWRDPSGVVFTRVSCR